ncbi:ACSL4 [Cordylochernes scorpioides]|uniref:ACSL4 n=1 Tax=Cordylochernes scorpioides TaxID=51811 RepID=A0ABY6KQQ6_9ARAC|nr:ACSL4 [Cordylochernes scorpioides]
MFSEPAQLGVYHGLDGLEVEERLRMEDSQAACRIKLVLDRIKKAFFEGAKQKGPVAHALLNLAVNYKIKWHKKGYRTPFLNR